MSYIRPGHNLKDFKGESNLYVFYSSGDYVEDYDNDYSDNASFAQLIINIFRREIKDKDYIEKIKGILADKLSIHIR